MSVTGKAMTQHTLVEHGILKAIEISQPAEG
jgi:hypothetical protein